MVAWQLLERTRMMDDPSLDACLHPIVQCARPSLSFAWTAGEPLFHTAGVALQRQPGRAADSIVAPGLHCMHLSNLREFSVHALTRFGSNGAPASLQPPAMASGCILAANFLSCLMDRTARCTTATVTLPRICINSSSALLPIVLAQFVRWFPIAAGLPVRCGCCLRHALHAMHATFWG